MNVTDEEFTSEAPDLIGVGGQEMVAGARRLGLEVRQLLGVVTSTSPLQVTVDGDEFTSVGAVSTIGYIRSGARVYLLTIPPAGVFIVGRVNPPVKEVGITPVQVTPSATSFTQVESFTAPFTVTPAVVINIASGAGETAQWHVRAINVTKNGFTIFLFKTSGVAANAWTSAYNIHWNAKEVDE